MLKRKAESESAFNWNTLFLRSATVADAMSDAFGIAKGDLLSQVRVGHGLVMYTQRPMS